MTNHGVISCELLRTLAEEAWDGGDTHRAAVCAQAIDTLMLELLQQDEGRQIAADEVPLIVPADRA